MKTLKVLAIVAVTGLVGMATVHANSKDANGSSFCKKIKSHKGEMKEIFKQLNLSDTQKTALKENRDSMRSQMKVHRAKRHGQRMENMAKFISKKGFNKEAFMKMQSEKSAKRSTAKADNFAKVIAILTPEQRIKLVKILQEKKNKF